MKKRAPASDVKAFTIKVISLVGAGYLAAVIFSCDKQDNIIDDEKRMSKHLDSDQGESRSSIEARDAKRPGGKGNQKIEQTSGISRIAIIDQLSADPGAIESMISNSPPGSRRADFIRDLLSALGEESALITPETVVHFLKVIDQSALPEDQSQLLGSRMNRLISRLSKSESTTLLTEVEGKPMRVAVGYGIGAKLAKERDLDLSFTGGLPEFDRVNIISSYGERYEFATIEEMAEFTSSVKVTDADKNIVVAAAINSADNLPHEELIAESVRISANNQSVGLSMFKRGFESMFNEDSIKGSRYLTDNKENIPEIYYREAVSIIVKRLNDLGDKSSAKDWAKELK